MTSLDNLTAAFECLWEAKIYLLRTIEGAPGDLQPQLRSVTAEVAATRDRIEKILIELQERQQPAHVPHPE